MMTRRPPCNTCCGLQEQWGKLAGAWDKFDDNQLNQLKTLASNNLDALMTQIPIEDLAALSAAVQNKLDMSEKLVNRLKSITLVDVASWADEQWDRVPVDNLVSMGWSVLQKVPIDELGTWTQVYI